MKKYFLFYFLTTTVLIGCNINRKVGKKEFEIKVNEPYKTYMVHDYLPEELKDSIKIKNSSLVELDSTILCKLVDENYGCIFRDSSNMFIDSLILKNDYEINMRNNKVTGITFKLSHKIDLNIVYLDEFKYIDNIFEKGILPDVEQLKKEQFYLIQVKTFGNKPAFGINRGQRKDSLEAYIPNIVIKIDSAYFDPMIEIED